MNQQIILALLLATMSILASAKTSIPKQFHGIWGNPESCKSVLEIGNPDTGCRNQRYSG